MAVWGRRRLFVRPEGVILDLDYPYSSRQSITCRWHDNGCLCSARVHRAVMAARERDRFNERLLAA